MRWQAAVAAALLTGCAGGSTSSDGTTPSPQPTKPGEPASPGKSGLTYQPSSAVAYRIERHDSLTLQYPGGAVQQQVRDRIAFVHVTVGAASGGGATYPLVIVLDSLEAWENGQPVDSAAAAKGTKWTGTLGADGALSQLQADRGGTLSDELSGRLRFLFPRLPATGVRNGMEWADSSEYKLVADAFPGAEKQMTTYHATEAGKGIRLESTGTYTRTGSRQQADQSLEMTGTGNRHGVHEIGNGGMILSAHGNDSGDMTITVPAVGQTVPVKQTGSYSIAPASPR